MYTIKITIQLIESQNVTCFFIDEGEKLFFSQLNQIV